MCCASMLTYNLFNKKRFIGDQIPKLKGIQSHPHTYFSLQQYQGYKGLYLASKLGWQEIFALILFFFHLVRLIQLYSRLNRSENHNQGSVKRWREAVNFPGTKYTCIVYGTMKLAYRFKKWVKYNKWKFQDALPAQRMKAFVLILIIALEWAFFVA